MFIIVSGSRFSLTSCDVLYLAGSVIKKFPSSVKVEAAQKVLVCMFLALGVLEFVTIAVVTLNELSNRIN